MKAGFIQALYSMKDLDRTRVALIATTDEETGSATTRTLIEDVSKIAKAVLVLESAIDGKLKVGRKGTSWYRITDRKSTRLNSSHMSESRMPSSA